MKFKYYQHYNKHLLDSVNHELYFNLRKIIIYKNNIYLFIYIQKSDAKKLSIVKH